MADTIARGGAIQWEFEAPSVAPEPSAAGLTFDVLARGVGRFGLYEGFASNHATFNVAWASASNSIIQGPAL